MGNYWEQQVKRQAKLIHDCSITIFNGDSSLHMLEKGENNLYAPIKDGAIKYFNINKISWWGGKSPTRNTISSQIACLNHLFPIRCDAKAVKEIINNIVKVKGDPEPFEEFDEVLTIKSDEDNKECARGYIAFEVVSDKSHLNERQHKRGSNCTSIDALIYAKDKHNKKWLILIEWKYTESYNKFDKSTEIRKTAKGYRNSGDTRMKCYNDLIEKSNFLRHLSDEQKKWPANADDYKGSVYYQEPYYQLMRQTLWAEQMIDEDNRALERVKADDYLHIHVVPKENSALRGNGFDGVADSMEKTWRSMLKKAGDERYAIIDPEDLMKPIEDSGNYPALINYLRTRYWKIASDCN